MLLIILNYKMFSVVYKKVCFMKNKFNKFDLEYCFVFIRFEEFSELSSY